MSDTEQTDPGEGTGPLQTPLTRRSLLRLAGSSALAMGAGALLDACSSGLKSGGGGSSGKITIGFVSPQTGALAEFATPNNFVLSQVRQSSAYTNGFTVGGKKYSVDIVVADSQSDPNRASQVAHNLILNNHVDMIVTSSAPETTNPVALACESEGIPCVSTVVPWESWYVGLGGNPLNPTTKYEYNVMFFFGLKEFAECFVPMWARMSTDKVVAGTFPNDADGNAFRAAWPSICKAAGYNLIDGGAYPDGATDFTSMISKFKSQRAEIYINCPLPPDFNTFWKQAHEQGFRPKLATVAKVLLFPADVANLGPLVNNIATDSWWSPFAPYRSSLTGQTAAQLATDYQSSTGQQWTQSIGSTYALFEVAKNAFTSASDPHDHKDVADKLHSLSYEGMNGAIDFASGPAPGVAIVPAAGVQWKPGKPGAFTNFPFAMYVVDNSNAHSWPINGTLEPTNA